MAVLTADRATTRADGALCAFKVGVDIIYEGALVMTDATGWLVAGSDTTGCNFAGVAYETCDNSGGSAGDKKCKVHLTGIFDFAYDGTATQASVGALLYLKDDQTLDVVGDVTHNIPVGRVVEFVDASTVKVDIGRRA